MPARSERRQHRATRRAPLHLRREYTGAELAMKCAEAPEALDRQHGETPLPKRERSFSSIELLGLLLRHLVTSSHLDRVIYQLRVVAP